jgi:hypothetical protein
LVVIEGGERPLTTPTATTQTTAPQPTAFGGASEALVIAQSARTFALAAAITVAQEKHQETCRTDAGADARCPTCGNFAPPGARCGVCGSVHGHR